SLERESRQRELPSSARFGTLCGLGEIFGPGPVGPGPFLTYDDAISLTGACGPRRPRRGNCNTGRIVRRERKGYNGNINTGKRYGLANRKGEMPYEARTAGTAGDSPGPPGGDGQRGRGRPYGSGGLRYPGGRRAHHHPALAGCRRGGTVQL